MEISRREVERLIHFYEVFLEFNDVAMKSEVAKLESEFWGFAKWSFGGEIVHRIDRLCERNPKQKRWRVNSLSAFLEELKKHAQLVNREQFVGVVPNCVDAFVKKFPDNFDPPDCWDFYHRNEQFDRLVGKKRFSLHESNIERDLKKLKSVSKKISKYRNKHLAHIAHDRKRFKKPPSLLDFEEAIFTLWKITNKYVWLIKKSYYPIGSENIDITEIFRRPWIRSISDKKTLQRIFFERQQKSIRRIEGG